MEKLHNIQVGIIRMHLQMIIGKSFDRYGEVEKGLKFRVHLHVLKLGKYLHIVCRFGWKFGKLKKIK